MTKYKLVPVEPTREMIDAGQPAEMAKEVAIESAYFLLCGELYA
jgi:hypothetical protein